MGALKFGRWLAFRLLKITVFIFLCIFQSVFWLAGSKQGLLNTRYHYLSLFSYFLLWEIAKERHRHIQLVGATGAGKSTAIQQLIDWDINHNIGFILIEPMGSLSERVCANSKFKMNHRKRYFKNLIYLDFDTNPPPLNFFELPLPSDPLEKQRFVEALAEDLAEALGLNMRPSPNEVQQLMLKNLLTLGFYSDNATLQSLLDWLRMKEAYEIESLVKEIPSIPLQKYFQTDFFSPLSLKSKEALRNRLSGLLSSLPIYKSLCSRQCVIDFAQILRKKKFVIVKASIGVLGSFVAKTIGNIILSLLYLYAFRGIASGNPAQAFHVYIDETQYFASSSLAHALTGARQTGLSYCLSYQEFSQEGIPKSLQRTILLETAVKIFGQMRIDDQKEAVKILGLENKRAMESLPVGSFYVKSGIKKAFLLRLSQAFSIHQKNFGDLWKGRKFMKKSSFKQLKQYLGAIHKPRDSVEHYQWPETLPLPTSYSRPFSNFSPHGIPEEKKHKKSRSSTKRYPNSSSP